MKIPALGLQVALLMACGGAKEGPAPAATPRSAEAAESARTDLPAERPTPLEIDLRRRTAQGDDEVLKITDAGARYGVAHGKARVALRYRLGAEQLDTVWAAFVREGFDRIESTPQDQPPHEGTSLHLTVQGERISVSALGRSAPAGADAEAYGRCVDAADALRPRDRSATIVTVRWDPSMAEHAAALDVDLGSDLVGVHRLAGALPQVELHLARPRPLQVLVRHGSPAQSTALTIQAGKEAGIELTYDGVRGEVVARPLVEPEP